MRYGSQQPTFHTVGEWDHSDGSDAAGLFGSYGISFYPAQAYELELMLARNPGGGFASRTIAISKPRQNGKSFAARFYSIWMAVIEGKRVLYSAHHAKTVRKMFKEIAEFVEGHTDFARLLRPGSGIYRAEGREGIYFADGGMIEFATRTNAGGRGETYDIVVIDEAQELTDEQYDALMPTTIASESGDPQKIYIGTPPNDKCPGTVFRGLHDKAHSGAGGSVWWLEWAAVELGDVRDRELWYATNPALGYRIKDDVVADAADSATSIDGFFREYLGWWNRASKALLALDPERWEGCEVANPPENGVTSYGVKFSLDGKAVVVSACLRPAVGAPHVEVVKAGSASRGIAWVASYLISRAKATAQITIDGKAKAAALEKKLRDAKLPKRQVVVAGTSDIIAACSMLEEAVSGEAVTHFGQPGLDNSAMTSTRRAIGGNGGWGFDGEDPLPIESCALAYWGAMTTKRNPNRKARVG